jgi:hypothetical protein
MAKDLVLQLRYLGVIPQPGYIEYGFRIEDKDKNVRQIVVTIEEDLFSQNRLMLQEAPDLCYQKILNDLCNETAETPICSRVPVTASDVALYRSSHPNAKSRVRPARRNQE